MPHYSDDKALAEFLRGFGNLMEDSPGLFLFAWELPEYRYHVWPVRGLYDAKDGAVYNLDDYLDRVIHPADRHLVGERYHSVADGRVDVCEISCRLVDKAAEATWTNIHLRSTKNTAGEVQVMGGYAISIEDMRRLDHLTGLVNQNQYYADYANGFESGEGYLVQLDIDDFKFVNEMYGRAFGDKLLKTLADILQQYKAECVRAYRYQDDSFVLVAPGVDAAGVVEMYSTFAEEFGKRCRALQEDLFCTISAGAAAFPADSGEVSQLTRFANSAWNTAKSAGKDTLVFFSLKEYEKYQKELSLQAELRTCVRAGFKGFWLQYQPQVSLQTGRVEGAEALLRWNSAEGLVPPDRFIPVLERNGLIVEVGRWVLKEAISQCRIWRGMMPHFVMSINISNIQLERDNLVAFVSDCLQQNNLPGSAIVLELTESEHLHNYNYFNESLQPLHNLGVSVAIDDFGTGYSSLGYFKELHINQIKIDRCFLTRIRESEYDYRLIEFIIELAHSTHMEVCVEGLEVLEELKVLMPLKPDLIQGYYFGRPMAPKVFEETVVERGGLLDEKLVKQAAQLQAKAQALSPMALSSTQEFCQLLDELDYIVHITELDSHRMIYLNRAGRLAFGARGYEGRPCYEVLYGQTSPCEGCNRAPLNREEFLSWHADNPLYCGRYEVRVKLVPWEGRLVRMAYYTLLGEEAQKRERETTEALLASCVRALQYETKPENAVDTVLQYIGDYYKPERVVVFTFTDERLNARKRFEWCHDKVTPEVHVNTKHVAEDFPNWTATLRRGQPVVVTAPDALAQTNPEEYAALQRNHIHRRAILAPFHADGELLGFMIVDNAKSHNQNPDFAMGAGYYIGNEILKLRLRNEAEEACSVDPVTGAYTRQRLLQDAQRDLSGMVSMGIISLEVVAIQKLNKTLGLAGTDDLLRGFVADVRTTMPGCWLYRFGPGKFAAICPSVTRGEFDAFCTALQSKRAGWTFDVAVGMEWSAEEKGMPLFQKAIVASGEAKCQMLAERE